MTKNPPLLQGEMQHYFEKPYGRGHWSFHEDAKQNLTVIWNALPVAIPVEGTDTIVVATPKFIPGIQFDAPDQSA